MKFNRKNFVLFHDLRSQGLDLNLKNAVLSSSNESLKHFVVKALVGRIIQENGYLFLTEAPIAVEGNIHYIDVFDCSNGIAYEIQGNMSPSALGPKKEIFKSQMVRDVILINMHEVSSDIYTAYRQLKRIVV